MKFVEEKEVNNEFNSMTGDFLNQDDIANSVVSYSDLVNKIDLVLKNQEVIINLLSSQDKVAPEQSCTRKVYKKRLNSFEYIAVGDIDDKNRFTLKEPNKETAPWLIPSLYSRHWYTITSTKNENGIICAVYTEIVPSNDTKQIYVTQEKEHHVTGYLTKDGRAVYYDQYL